MKGKVQISVAIQVIEALSGTHALFAWFGSRPRISSLSELVLDSAVIFYLRHRSTLPKYVLSKERLQISVAIQVIEALSGTPALFAWVGSRPRIGSLSELVSDSAVSLYLRHRSALPKYV
jgi:hypothetical protein